MKYNNKLKHLPLPEYGRHIQNMVDHCATITDREERNFCARSIVHVMAGMFPELKIENGNKDNIYWDHLAVMGDFTLDIDYPCEIVQKELLERKPEKIPYTENDIIYRHYGHLIQELIAKAKEMKDSAERDALVLSIANQMKQAYVMTNQTEVSDFKIFKDLYGLSGGQFELTETDCRLVTPILEQSQTSKTKKKKK